MSVSLSPQLLHADHLEELQYLAETVGTKLWACKRACPRCVDINLASPLHTHILVT